MERNHKWGYFLGNNFKDKLDIKIEKLIYKSSSHNEVDKEMKQYRY